MLLHAAWLSTYECTLNARNITRCMHFPNSSQYIVRSIGQILEFVHSTSWFVRHARTRASLETLYGFTLLDFSVDCLFCTLLLMPASVHCSILCEQTSAKRISTMHSLVFSSTHVKSFRLETEVPCSGETWDTSYDTFPRVYDGRTW